MRSLSYWAKYNLHKARLSIVLLETTLFILSFTLGLLLLQSGIHVPVKTVVVPLALLSVALLIAPAKNRWMKRRLTRYWRQRISFFLVGLSAFLFTTFMVSSEKLLTWNTYSTLAGNHASLLVKPVPGRSISAKKWNKALKLLLKKKRDNAGLKVLLIVLVITGSIALLYLIGGLACSLSCNGNDAAAWAILLLGIPAIVILCVWLIRKITKRQKALHL